VKSITVLHGGTVQVNSTLDEGSCFVMRLPGHQNLIKPCWALLQFPEGESFIFGRKRRWRTESSAPLVN
jgi:hypothetical protein